MSRKGKLKQTDINKNLFDQAMDEQNIDEWNGTLKLLKTGEIVNGFRPKTYKTVKYGERKCNTVCTTPRNYNLSIENSYNAPTFDKIVKHIGYNVHIYDEPRRLDPK